MVQSSLSSVRVSSSRGRAYGIGGGLNGGRLRSRRTQALVHHHMHLVSSDRPVLPEPPSVVALVGSSKPCWPHLRLMRAVLDDAVSIVVFGGGRVSSSLRQETLHWFLADDTQWTFSFHNVCEALDLDVDRVRARMAPWLTTRSSERVVVPVALR